jgi:hypothetical protein
VVDGSAAETPVGADPEKPGNLPSRSKPCKGEGRASTELRAPLYEKFSEQLRRFLESFVS